MEARWSVQALQKQSKIRDEFTAARRAIDAAIQQLDKVRADEIAPLGEEMVRLNGGVVQFRAALSRARAEVASATPSVERAAAGGLTSSQAASLEATLARLEAAMGSVLFQISSMNPKLDRLPSLMRRTGEEIAGGLRKLEDLKTKNH